VTYPLYYLYENLIIQRNTLFMMIGAVVISYSWIVLELWNRFPRWRKLILWSLGYGLYYATLVGVAVYWKFGV
jgi:hypothetical protein